MKKLTSAAHLGMVAAVLTGFGLITPLANEARSAPIFRTMSPDPRPAQFRGFSAYERMLQDRLGDPAQRIDLGQYLGASEKISSRPLLALLGTYEGSMSLKNGTPNALNYLLWTVLISGFVEDQLTYCATRTPVPATSPLHPDYTQWLSDHCRVGVMISDQEWAELWTWNTGFDAPFEEYENWLSEVKSFASSVATPPVEEQIRFALSLALLNPYVILE